MTKIVGIIPAHLASVRFPRKILFPFSGVPMIEHVRRRALMTEHVSEVYVATGDAEIAAAVEAGGGKVIHTREKHQNGTSRIAEAARELDCTHTILLQGDEPLLLPRHIDRLAEAILKDPTAQAWNVTGPIDAAEELDRHSFVKCAVTPTNRIMYCFRRSPSTAPFEIQQLYIRKILGMIAYEKNFLLALTGGDPQIVETHESIEQMRIIETGHTLISVPVDTSLPSVNEPHEADIVLEHVRSTPEQQALLARVVGA